MKATQHVRTLAFLLVLLPLLFIGEGCNFKPTEPIQWDADLLVPIASADVSITDLLQDTTYISTNADNSLSLVFQDTLFQTSLADFIEIPDTVVERLFTLDSLEIRTNDIVEEFSLGFLARRLQDQGNFVGTILLNSHGDTLDFFPTVSGITSGPLEVDATNFFEFAELRSGKLRIQIDNELPLDMEDVTFVLKNKNLGDTLLYDTYSNIPANSAFGKVYELENVFIESDLVGEMVNLTIPAKAYVPVDTTDFIRFTMEGKELKIVSATAVFPEQTIVDSTEILEYQFPPEFADVQITKVGVRSGSMRVLAQSTIEDTILFTYEILSATQNGQPAGITRKLFPASGGSPSLQEEIFDLSNFTLDLTDGPLGYNTMLQRYSIGLLYSGNVINIGIDDTIYIYYGIIEIDPSYVEGYIGRDTIRFEGQEAIDLLDFLDIGGMNLANPRATLVFDNSFGLDARIEVNELNSFNSTTGNSVNLASSGILSQPLEILGPDLPDTSGHVITTFELNNANTNGNLSSFINNLPNEIAYDIAIEANHNGSQGNLTNFATGDSEINIYFDFEVPMEGSFSELNLVDTTELNFSEEAVGEVEAINGGQLKILLENEYPFEVHTEAVIYDENWTVVDTLTSEAMGNNVISASVVDGNGYLLESTTSTIAKSFDRDLIKFILEYGKYVVFRFTIDTKPEGQEVKILSTYQVHAKLVGDFEYRVNYNQGN